MVEKVKGCTNNFSKGTRGKQYHDDKKSIPLKHHEVVVILRREKSPENLTAVQRGDRHEIEQGKEQINPHESSDK